MKSLKRRWEQELDEKIPALSQEIKEMPISVKERERFDFSKFFAVYKKRIASGVAACLACVVCLIFALPLFSQTPKNAVIALEINPRAVFSVDDRGNVVSVVAGNADADVILSGGRSKQMVDKSIDQASQIFVEYAARLGYLDLSAKDKTSAVRVSGCGDKQQLLNVEEALSSYFRDKGAYTVVVKESVSPQELCRRVGMELKTSMEGLLDAVKTLPTLYVEREVDTEEKKQNSLTGYTETLLRDNKEKILQNAEDLENLFRLHTDIYESEEAKVFGVIRLDYWRLMRSDYFSVEEASESFKALLKEMKDALTDYENKYSTKIDGYWELASLHAAYENLRLDWRIVSVEEFLAYLLEDFNFSKMLANYARIEKLLSNVHQRTPNANEWLTASGAYLQNKFVALVGEGKVKYEEARSSLSEATYESYTNKLIQEYGSLSAYWESLFE